MSKVQIEETFFDAKNLEHLKAFQMRCLGIIQPNGSIKHMDHSSLRFKLEKPHTSINNMMFYKVSQAWLELNNISQ